MTYASLNSPAETFTFILELCGVLAVFFGPYLLFVRFRLKAITKDLDPGAPFRINLSGLELKGQFRNAGITLNHELPGRYSQSATTIRHELSYPLEFELEKAAGAALRGDNQPFWNPGPGASKQFIYRSDDREQLDAWLGRNDVAGLISGIARQSISFMLVSNEKGLYLIFNGLPPADILQRLAKLRDSMPEP